jgi:hypothetical protein
MLDNILLSHNPAVRKDFSGEPDEYQANLVPMTKIPKLYFESDTESRSCSVPKRDDYVRSSDCCSTE